MAEYGYADNVFTGIIDQDGYIYKMNGYRKGPVIGVDTEKEQEYQKTIADMTETLDSYYAKLVQLGVIQLPKTPEDIAAEQLRLAQEQAAEQAQINQALLEAISSLKSEMGELKNGITRSCDESSVNSIGENSASDRKIPAGSKGSNKPSVKDVA